MTITEQIDETEETEQPTYRRRPLRRVSHRKYKEAIAALKAACASERLSLTKRLRAVELLMILFGEDIGIPNARDRRSAKQLVGENSFERQVRERVRQGVLSATARKAKQEAERLLAQQEQQQKQEDADLLEAFWAFKQNQEPTGNA